jgi:hypothetical protein
MHAFAQVGRKIVVKRADDGPVMHVCVYAYIHTYMHTYIHVYTYTEKERQRERERERDIATDRHDIQMTHTIIRAGWSQDCDQTS